ncbi:NUDIX hydrolase [Streptomyces sp. NPDC054757]
MSYSPPLWPVSVKGVVIDGYGRVLLLKNERQEWELPGGRLEIANAPTGQEPDLGCEEALAREVREETGWTVKADRLLDTWVYEPIPGRRVLIVTYACTVLTPEREPLVSHEHKQVGLFTEAEVPGLTMPDGYKQSIATWYAQLAPTVDDHREAKVSVASEGGQLDSTLRPAPQHALPGCSADRDISGQEVGIEQRVPRGCAYGFRTGGGPPVRNP